MKLFILLACLLVAHGVEKKNDLQRQRLSGKVRMLTNCQCPLRRDGTMEKAWCSVYTFKFDEAGNQVEDNDYTGGYLANGLGTLNHKRLYKYDEYGRQSEVNEYNAEGKLNQKVVYRYDDAGNRIARENYTPDGVLWCRSVFGYDDKGNRIEYSKYSPDSMLLEHFTYSYDKDGNVILEQHVLVRSAKKTEVQGKEPANYDATKTVKTMDYVKTYTYDDSGRLVTELDNMSSFPAPFETHISYENTDDAGNWLRQINTEQGKRVSITERIIEYYR